MFKFSDLFIAIAVAIAFAVSGVLWFGGQQLEGIFTAIWVPAILGFGAYVKLCALMAMAEAEDDDE